MLCGMSQINLLVTSGLPPITMTARLTSLMLDTEIMSQCLVDVRVAVYLGG